VEVIYSRKGQTADDLIERAACRFLDYGEVLVVTDDVGERNLVLHMGAMAESCANFQVTVQATLDGVAEDVKLHNRRERLRYGRRARFLRE